MKYLVLKRLVKQVFVIIILIFAFYFIQFYFLSSERLIKTTLPTKKGDNIYVFSTISNEAKPSLIIVDEFGNIITRKDGFLFPHPENIIEGRDSLLFFLTELKGNIFENIESSKVVAYEFNKNKEEKFFKREDITEKYLDKIQNHSQLTFPYNIGSKIKQMPFCLNMPNIQGTIEIECFSIKKDDFSFTPIDTSILNQKVNSIVKGDYSISTFTNLDSVSLQITYQPNLNTQDIAFEAEIKSEKITIITDKLSDIANQLKDKELDLSFSGGGLLYDFPNFDYLLTTFEDQGHTELVNQIKPDDSLIKITNPIIGISSMSFRGKSYQSWFNLFQKASFGSVGNNTGYFISDGKFYMFNDTTKDTYLIPTSSYIQNINLVYFEEK